MSRVISLVVCAVLLCAIAGCGGPEYPPRYPVTGVVTFEGEPVANAQVVFHSDSAPRLPSGVTDATGKFSLTTVTADDGAMEGVYKVTVYKPGGTPPPVEEEPAGEEPVIDLEGEAYAEQANQIASGKIDSPFGVDSLLPPQYAEPSLTDLRLEVSATAENHFVIRLSE